MPKQIGILLALSVFSFSFAISGDLYLLSIDSDSQLNLAEVSVDHAYGTIDGRFLVELELEQAENLRAEGLKLEYIAPDFDPYEFAVTVPIGFEEPRKSPPFPSVYAGESGAIVQGTEEHFNAIRKQGYTVTSLVGRETPLFYNPPQIPVSYLRYLPSDTLADLVEQDSLYSYDTRLEDFRTRYIYTDSIVAARDWLIQKFQEFGYVDVSYNTFYHNNWPCYNVICVKPGTAEPDKVIVIGGHYDSINSESNPMEFAPGADDNASGTAATLELARILSMVDTKKTIIFMAFSAEEVGLVGSYNEASQLYNSGTDVEFMLNFDMVAYTDDSDPDVTLYSGPFAGYAQAIMDAYTRLGELTPVYAGSAGNSDHAPFADFGYHVAYIQEGDFNFPGWHTDIDVSTRLDFPYFTKLVRGAAAAVAFVDKAAAATNIEDIYDVGDGQALRVVWSNCNLDYDYEVIYGTTSGNYTDTVSVPPGQCYFDVTGLSAGQTYYFAVLGTNPEGYGPITVDEESEIPLVVPRAPVNFGAEPDSGKVILSWNSNIELDLDHYQIYRREAPGGDWSIIESNHNDTYYEDISALPQTLYDYKVTAVDADMNESPESSVGTAAAATFDGGILLVDEYDTQDPGMLQALEAYYDSLFGDNIYAKQRVSGYLDTTHLSRSIAGQYNTIFWMDDDWNYNIIPYSSDSLEWFLNYRTNLFVAGYETVYYLTGSVPLSPGNFAYDHFGIELMTLNYAADFIGAKGQAGWPNIAVDPTAGLGPRLPAVSLLDVLPNAQVIYTYDAFSDNPANEDFPVGVVYDNGISKGVALTFPLYYMNTEEANALVNYALTYFAGLSYLPGDFNNDGFVNILDILNYIDYKFKGGEAPLYMNAADVNGDCIDNVLDVMYLIDYKFREGPAPVAGCVE